MNTNASCTIYRKTLDTITMMEVYERHYVPYCFWSDKDAMSKITNGVENSDEGQIIIPYKQNADDSMTFVKPVAYSNLVDKTDYFTSKTGDTIVRGEVPEDVSFKDLEKLYDDVLKITSVAANLYGDVDMQNIEVGGR